MPRRSLVLATIVSLCVGFTAAAQADQLAHVDPLTNPWPNGHIISKIDGEAITFPSASPFTLEHVTEGDLEELSHEARGRLFLPPHATPLNPVPGVVLLHGARGVSGAREITYARQFAAMGIAALVVDAFASRRHLATDFTRRLIEITETMVLADAFAAQRTLAARPEVDAQRIALIGFSYGGMASLFAAHRQVSDLYRGHFNGKARQLNGHAEPLVEPFRAHVSFYAPCIADFEDTRSTGAPVLMLWGDQDELIDETRCQALADDLREGGSDVDVQVFEGAYHQWDGGMAPWRMYRGLAGCSFRVDRDGEIYGTLPGTPFRQIMTNTFNRFLILALCIDGTGFVMAKDYNVRVRSNGVVGRFLSETLR